ncbi:MAG: hypothetical protein IPK13_20505 [Deltaproteobacteria bacterium]|nr:hypothetical protein [Deltaproteobacteria bacterium]
MKNKPELGSRSSSVSSAVAEALRSDGAPLRLRRGHVKLRARTATRRCGLRAAIFAWVGVCFWFFGLCPHLAIAARPTVAMPKVAGGGATGVRIGKTVASVFRSKGLRVIGDRDLRDSGRSSPRAGGSWRLDAARAVGADFLVIIKNSGRLGRYRAEGRVVRVEDGRVIKRASQSFSRKGAVRAARALARSLVDRMRSAQRADVPASSSSSRNAEEDPSAWMMRPAEGTPPSGAQTGESSTTPGTPDGPGAGASSRKDLDPVSERDPGETRSRRSSESGRRILSLYLGAGARALNRYALVAQGASTGHDYAVAPLLLGLVEADVRIPGTGAELRLQLSTASVQYEIEVDPPITPTDPKGRFLDGVLGARYLFGLATIGREGVLELGPAAVVNRNSVSVDRQDRDIVTGYGAWSIGAGGAIVLEGSRAWRLEAEATMSFVTQFVESPVTSGTNGRGLRFDTELKGSFWFNDNVGIFSSAQYGFQQIGFTGSGTRGEGLLRVNEEAPPVKDATLLTSDLKICLGIVAGF